MSTINSGHYGDGVPTAPGRTRAIWVAGFAHILVVAGFCNLAVILDAYSRNVIGYVLSQRLETPLALARRLSRMPNGRGAVR